MAKKSPSRPGRRVLAAADKPGPVTRSTANSVADAAAAQRPDQQPPAGQQQQQQQQPGQQEQPVPGALQQRAHLQRLDALEQKVQQLTAENAELKQQLASLERSSTSSAAALGQTNAAALCATLEPQLDELQQQLAKMTEQVEQQQAATQATAAAVERHGSFLSAMGVQDAASARGQARMWDSTQPVAALQEQLRQTRAELATLTQQYEAQQVTSGQLHSAVQALQQQRDKQGGTVTVVAHAPSDMHPDQLVEHLARCGGISTRSFLSARLVYEPRSSSSSEAAGGRQGQAGGQAGAAESSRAAASGSGGAAADSSGAAGSSRRAAGRQPLGVFEVTLASASLKDTYLGGRMRGNLRRANLRIYVEAKLTQQERAQRKALQQVRRSLIANGTKVRWVGLALQQWQAGGASSRGQWVAVLPPPPPSPLRAAAASDDGGAGVAG